MRLQTEGAPDPADGRMRQADLGSHGTDRPVGRVFGRCVQRALDDLRNLRVRHRAGPAGTIFVGQAFNAIFDKPPPPFADGVLMYPQAESVRSSVYN